MRKGDKAAFKYIFERNHSVLCRFAYLFLHDRVRAEEIADDVLCYIWEHRDSIEITQSIRSYLMQSVKNRCINELKSNAYIHEKHNSSFSNEENVNFLESVFHDPDTPLGYLIYNELEDKLTDCINNLPEACRKVFIKARIEQEKYERIAAELNISVSTVKYHMKNALTLLQKSLAGYLKWLVLIFFIQN